MSNGLKESGVTSPDQLTTLLNQGYDLDCLVELIESAENGVGDSRAIKDALERHVLLEAEDGSIELKCGKCAVTCTVTKVGGSTIALIHDNGECKKLKSL